MAQKAVKGVANFYERESSFGDGLAPSVKPLWKERGVDHAVIFSVATKLHQVEPINSFIASSVAEGEGFFTGLGTVHHQSPRERLPAPRNRRHLALAAQCIPT